jgi:hypothetical protein
MITVAGQKRLLSDLVASIKADPLTPWHKGYDCYLLRLNGNIYYSKSHIANTYEYARLV